MNKEKDNCIKKNRGKIIETRTIEVGIIEGGITGERLELWDYLGRDKNGRVQRVEW
jgi:hypothetical protein